MSEIPKRIHFPKVREAREALKERALEVQEMMFKVARQAMDTGDHEAAIDALKWLGEHMPDEEGITMIDSSIDSKLKADMGPKGPQIQMSIQLGGMPPIQSLPPATTVIDVLPDVIEESCQTQSQPSLKSAPTLPPASTTSPLPSPSAQSADDKPSS